MICLYTGKTSRGRTNVFKNLHMQFTESIASKILALCNTQLSEYVVKYSFCIKRTSLIMVDSLVSLFFMQN